MKTSSLSSVRGSAFITVMGFCAVLLLLIASVLKYSGAERQFNNRSKLMVEARTAAEGISEYGVAQVKNLLETNRTFTDSTWGPSDEALFLPTGTYANTVTMPPDTFWGGGHIVTSAGASSQVPKMHVGKILQNGGLTYIDPANADNENDPLKGKWAFRYNMDVLSRATAVDSFQGSNVTMYMKQSFTVRAVPLFSNAVYYNMDMEVQPGPNLIVTGSTHTNGRLFARSASNSPGYIQFAGPVTAVKGFWTNFHTSSGDNLMPFFQSINSTGALQTNATTGLVQILVNGTSNFKGMRLTANTSGYSPNLNNGTWVESTWELQPSGETWQRHLGDATPVTETTASKTNFANWISQTFAGNLMTNVNGLTPNRIQGIPDYTYVYGSVYPDPISGAADAPYTYKTSGNDLNNSAHALIETPRLTTAASYNAATENIKYSRSCGLYISVNTHPTATRVGHKPNGTPIYVGPASYRAFKTDGTEVILPGQNTYGESGTSGNTSTNPYATHKNARPIVQLYNIDYNSASGTFNQELSTRRRMTDMRRTAGGDPSNDSTTTFIHSTARSSSNKYIPKNLYMIDIDMMELKKAVRTIAVTVGSTITTSNTDYYATGLPTSGTYANYIYNPAATQVNVNLSDATRIITTNTSALTNGFSGTDWNGGVYIESISADDFDSTTTGTSAANIAQRKAITHEKHDSGVRLINGRGKIPSLNDTDQTGFTLATNDAVYVLGSFNCDGLDTTPGNTPTTIARLVPTTPGESTGHYYESGELPASIICDAVYLLSQPNAPAWNQQSAGWNDAYSACCENANNLTTPTNWNSNWATSAPASGNEIDGDFLSTAIMPYLIPYDSDSGTGAALTVSGNVVTPRRFKFDASFTEYSFAMLCGLVPTGKNGFNQTSGGLHNFPRFLEDWGGVECRVRGSMVALFECRVANDPWNLRVYAPPNRVWGYNLLFASGVMPPLTPKTIQIRRMLANDIKRDDYNILLNAWGYPTI